VFHNRGNERRVARQYRQTAVALISWRSDSKNSATRVRVSGGNLLMGAREFLAFLAFLWISGILEIASSTCVKPKSKD
jgi:hypothetical protein